MTRRVSIPSCKKVYIRRVPGLEIVSWPSPTCVKSANWAILRRIRATWRSYWWTCQRVSWNWSMIVSCRRPSPRRCSIRSGIKKWPPSHSDRILLCWQSKIVSRSSWSSSQRAMVSRRAILTRLKLKFAWSSSTGWWLTRRLLWTSSISWRTQAVTKFTRQSC